MNLIKDVSYGIVKPAAVIHEDGLVVINNGIKSYEYTDEQTGETYLEWRVENHYQYSPEEYIEYLESKLSQERADNDELLIDLDERVTVLEEGGE